MSTVCEAMMKVPALGLIALLVVGACASPDTVRLRPLAERQADLYPVGHTRADVTVAVDALASPARTEQYFGTDLRQAGILPIYVIVSNYGTRRLVIGPADVLVLRGHAVIDPLPLETVIDTVKRRNIGLGERAQEIDEYFVRSAFQETGIAPGASVRGLLYFPVAETAKPDRSRYWSVSRLLRDEDINVRVALTDADTGDRLRFGPLPVRLW